MGRLELCGDIWSTFDRLEASPAPRVANSTWRGRFSVLKAGKGLKIEIRERLEILIIINVKILNVINY